jgi:hypothetical protein
LSQAQSATSAKIHDFLPFAQTSNSVQLPHMRRIKLRDPHVATEKNIEYDEVHVIVMKTSMIITNFLSRMDSMKFIKVPTPRKSAELQQNEHTMCTTSRDFKPGDMLTTKFQSGS